MYKNNKLQITFIYILSRLNKLVKIFLNKNLFLKIGFYTIARLNTGKKINLLFFIKCS